MSVSEPSRLIANGTLGAAGSAVHSMPTQGAKFVSVSVLNSGANDLSCEIWGRPFAISGKDAALSSALGTVQPGAQNAKLLRIESLALEEITLVISSTLGTSYSVEMRGAF